MKREGVFHDYCHRPVFPSLSFSSIAIRHQFLQQSTQPKKAPPQQADGGVREAVGGATYGGAAAQVHHEEWVGDCGKYKCWRKVATMPNLKIVANPSTDL